MRSTISYNLSNADVKDNAKVFDADLDRFLNIGCVWSVARNYLQAEFGDKKSADKKKEKLMVRRFCDTDTAIALALIIRRYRKINLHSYSYRGLSKEMYLNDKSKKIKNIVEASEYFGMLCVFKSKHHVTGELCSHIVPTNRLVSLFEDHVFPNLKAEIL